MHVPPLPALPPIPEASLRTARENLRKLPSAIAPSWPLTPDVKGALTIDDMIHESQNQKR